MLDQFTRVGLMVRESLSSVGSRHVTVGVNANDTFQVIIRSAENAFSESLPQNPLPPTYGSNSWVRLQRVWRDFPHLHQQQRRGLGGVIFGCGTAQAV